MLLQPTSPFRTTMISTGQSKITLFKFEILRVRLSKLIKTHWMYELKEDSRLKKSYLDRDYFRRQDVPKIYKLNGAIYLSEIAMNNANKEFH